MVEGFFKAKVRELTTLSVSPVMIIPLGNHREQKFLPLGQLLPEHHILHIVETAYLPGLLGCLGAATMAAFAVSSIPLTDTELLEFAARLPLEYKLLWKSPVNRNWLRNQSA